MKYITPFFLAVTLAVAAPTNFTEPRLVPRMFQGNIQWYSRWSCTSPCVDGGDGCASEAQKHKGDLPNGQPTFTPGSVDGCWDRPAGAHAVSVGVDNGHKFYAINKSCKQWIADNYDAEEYEMLTADSESNGACTHLNHDKWQAVYYEWSDT